MTRSPVHRAVAAVLAAATTTAGQAVTIGSVPATNILYISGTPAIDSVLQAYATNATDLFCDSTAGSIDFYAGVAAGKQFQAVACAAGPGAAPVAPGTLIAYIKEDTGNSPNGITPVNNASTVPFPDFTTLDANCPAGVPLTLTGWQTQTPHICGNSYSTKSPAIAPNLGFADVEAAIFGLPFSNLTAFPTIDTVYAPVVSLGLYHALQDVQGLGNTDSVADMPSLPRGLLTAIFTGQVSNWANVQSSDGTLAVGSQIVPFGNSNLNGVNHVCWDGTAFSTAADCQNGTQGPAQAAASSMIYICQRGRSSGTERTAQIYFGELGCSAGVNPFNNPNKPGLTCSTDGCGWSTTFNTVLNFAGSGTGDVLSCLEAKDEQGEFAIGFASVENGFGSYQPNVARQDFRYIRIDGVVPSIENVAAGRYLYWSQSTGYYPVVSAPNYPTNVAANILSAFVTPATAFGSKEQLTVISYTLPAFDAGFLAIPGVGSSIPNHVSETVATFRNNPVNSFTRTAGVVPNSCQTPYLSQLAPDTADFPAWATP